MPLFDHVQELRLLIRSSYGIVAVKTTDDERLESLLMLLADHIDLPIFDWGRSTGLRRLGEASSIYDTGPPERALSHIRASKVSAIYHLRDVGEALLDPGVADLLQRLAARFSTERGVIVLSGIEIPISASLRPHVADFRLPPPRVTEYQELLTGLVRDLRKRMKIHVNISRGDLRRLLQHLQGLTLLEARKVLTKALVIDHALTAADIRRVIDAKRDVVRVDGLLEYYPVEETLTKIAALDGLKAWLAKRKKAILEPAKAKEYGLGFPKGVLLLGVPGTGKSLCAKAVAMEWGLPLLKMDPAGLYNKYVGQTEENFRRAMGIAERMSPVVLWIDEIEKAFASGDQDSGTSTRVLGTFLTWLQERKGDVFVVATANDVQKLPPELLRKGRFDEIFFVDLPDAEAREHIFRIHVEARRQPTERFDLTLLAGSSDGFSGAELEQVVVGALHTAFARERKLDTALILTELSKTKSLLQTMPERIESLREWARERTVSAN